MSLYPPGHPEHIPAGHFQSDLLVKVTLGLATVPSHKDPYGGSPPLPNHTAVWSTWRFAKGAAYPTHFTGRLFSTCLGMVGQGFDRALSQTETNTLEGGRFSQDTWINCMSWSIYGEDRFDIYRRGSLAWETGQYRVGQVPLSWGEIDTIDRDGLLLCKGVSYPNPMHLPTGTSFSIVLTFGAL